MTPSRLWLALCAVHGVVSMILWWSREPAVQALVWRADGWLESPWTLWTSAWVHLNTPHLIGNQLALGALTAAGWLVRPNTAATAAWALSWPLTQASLLAWPHIGYAVGLSGLLHAGAVVMAVHLLLGPGAPALARRWGWLLLAGVAVKLLLEQGWHDPVVWSSGAEMSVVQAAHLAGALWGLLLGLISTRWPTLLVRPSAQ